MKTARLLVHSTQKLYTPLFSEVFSFRVFTLFVRNRERESTPTEEALSQHIGTVRDIDAPEVTARRSVPTTLTKCL